MNNLGFGKKLLEATLIIQLAAFIVIFLDIPFLRQVIGFIYLSFLPGFLILKTIKLDKMSPIETILFSAGLSLAILMFIGLLSNEIFPVLNASPLSAFPSIATICAFTLFFYIASYRRSKNLSKQTTTNLKFFGAVPLLICVPFITIIGTELVKNSGNNLILLFLVILTSTIVLCTFSQRLFPSETYPLIVLVVSFFLLFHVTLISKYIIGFDIHSEYYFASLTSITSRWDRMIPHEYNAMLSVTILPVLFSNFLNLDINWVFKAVYPLVFSLIPLSQFMTYKKLMGSRVALLSTFFFVSMDTFYFQMLGLAKQIIAELFFALLILLLVEDKISLPKRKILFIIFSAALIVSHYALSYIFMFYILLTFCLLALLKRSDVKQGRLITGKPVLFYFFMAILWYVFVSPAALEALTTTANHVYKSILAQASGPGISGLVPRYTSPIHEVSKYLFYGLQLLIIVGLVKSMVKYKETKFSNEYFSMSLISLFILLTCIFVPFFAASLTMSRFYHIASFFLAPFSVLGISTILSLMLSLRNHLSASKGRHVHPRDAKPKDASFFLFSLLLVLLFLFQVGFVYEVAGDIPSSLPLSLNRIQTNPSSAPNLWSAYAPEQDVFGAKWLAQHMNNKSKVHSDRTSNFHVLTSYGMMPTATFRIYDYFLSDRGSDVSKGAYIYLRKLNVVYGIMEGPDPGKLWNTSTISPFLDGCNKIYTNGGSEIYKKPQ